MKRYQRLPCTLFICFALSSLVGQGIKGQEKISTVSMPAILEQAAQSLRTQLYKIEAQLTTIDKWRKPLESLNLAKRAKELKEKLRKLTMQFKESL